LKQYNGSLAVIFIGLNILHENVFQNTRELYFNYKIQSTFVII